MKEDEPRLTPEQEYQRTRELLLTVSILQTSIGITQTLALTRGLEFMKSRDGQVQTANLTHAVLQAMGVTPEQFQTALMDYELDPHDIWENHKGVILPVPPSEKKEG